MPYKSYDDNPFDDYQGYDQYGSDIEALMNRLIGQQRMIQATVKDEIDRTMTQITQTADEIRQEVSDFENDVYSEISQTADQIQQTITDLDDNLQSQITQNADSIQSTVTQIGELEGDIAAAQSSITQLADEIDLKVSVSDYTGSQIISRINLAPGSALIEADRIDFVGTASFTLGADSSGETVIAGAQIVLDYNDGSTFYNANIRGAGIEITNSSGYNGVFSPGGIILGRNGIDSRIYAFTNSAGTSHDLYVSSNGRLRLEADGISTLNGNEIITTANISGNLPSHNHAASNITSGTLNTNRIPNLNTSKITSGTFAEARIPTSMDSYIKSAFGSDIRLSISGNRLIVRQGSTITHEITMDVY